MCCCCSGLIHPGLIGTAPSKELLDIWNTREAALVEAGPKGTTLGGVLHTRPLGEKNGGCSLMRCVMVHMHKATSTSKGGIQCCVPGSTQVLLPGD